MSSRINLVEIQTQINSKKDFVFFLENLIADLKENPADWENDNLESFLEAMSAWVDDMDGFYKNLNAQSPNINWQFIGQLLLASRIYE